LRWRIRKLTLIPTQHADPEMVVGVRGKAGFKDFSAADRPTEALAPEPLAEGDEPDFTRHIRPLFRPMVRNSMKFAFDLWSEGDVAQYGAEILERLRAGTMPCDGGWPSAQVDLFERWLGSATARARLVRKAPRLFGGAGCSARKHAAPATWFERPFRMR
jgi:hypothetical protein